MKYAVTVFRVVRQTAIVETEADDERTACEKAVDEAVHLPDGVWVNDETLEIGWPEWEEIDEFTE